LINTPDSFKIDLTAESKKVLIINELDVAKNPFLAILRQQNEISNLQINLERERLKPDFRVGIINQSIEQNYNQNVVQVGVNVPIFTKAQQARIAASKITEQITKEQYQLGESQLINQLNALKIERDKLIKSIEYYEKFALPQADLIISTAFKSYQSGEIEYIEFIQNATQAWQIKESYWAEIQSFNQNIINIETIIGNDTNN
jgi:heavy metal efflux system protein